MRCRSEDVTGAILRFNYGLSLSAGSLRTRRSDILTALTPVLRGVVTHPHKGSVWHIVEAAEPPPAAPPHGQLVIESLKRPSDLSPVDATLPSPSAAKRLRAVPPVPVFATASSSSSSLSSLPVASVGSSSSSTPVSAQPDATAVMASYVATSSSPPSSSTRARVRPKALALALAKAEAKARGKGKGKGKGKDGPKRGEFTWIVSRRQTCGACDGDVLRGQIYGICSQCDMVACGKCGGLDDSGDMWCYGCAPPSPNKDS